MSSSGLQHNMKSAAVNGENGGDSFVGPLNKRGPFRQLRLYCKLKQIWGGGGRCHFPSGGAGFLAAPLAAALYGPDVGLRPN